MPKIILIEQEKYNPALFQVVDDFAAHYLEHIEYLVRTISEENKWDTLIYFLIDKTMHPFCMSILTKYCYGSSMLRFLFEIEKNKFYDHYNGWQFDSKEEFLEYLEEKVNGQVFN